MAAADLTRPYAELNGSTAFRQIMLWQAVGLVLLVCHVLLVRESVLLYPLVMLSIAWLYIYAPLAGLIVFFQILLYQNTVISVFSPDLSAGAFVMLQGSNFVVLALMAAVALDRLMAPAWRGKLGGLLLAVLMALALAAAYTVLGAAKAGATSALTYFREFTGPVFAVLVGLDVGRVWGYRTVARCFLYSAILALGLAVLEYMLPLDYYAAIHEVRYLQLKYIKQERGNTFYVPEDIVRHFTERMFNISGLGDDGTSSFNNFRFGGSIVNPVSFAYILAIVGLTGVSIRRPLWLLVVFPLLILIGVKGAMLLLVFSFALWCAWQLSRSPRFVVLSGIVFATGYVGFGLVHGMSVDDYHVLGFLGGVHGLMANPIGHGIGVGGNISATADAGFHWTGNSGFANTGTSFALESAVGVLIYQMGLASLAIFAVFYMLLRCAPFGRRGRGRTRLPQRQDLLFLALAMVVINGVFQEEAYAPYAAGMLALFCAVIVANGYRPSGRYVAMARRFDFRPAVATAPPKP